MNATTTDAEIDAILDALPADAPSPAPMNRKDLAMVDASMTEFDKVSAGLASLAARFPIDVVYDVTTTKGMSEAIAHRAAWRDPRINVEKLRKAAKAPVTALGRSIDERARWLTSQLMLGEEPIDALIKAEEARKEAIKQAKIDAENARVMGIQEAIAAIHETTAHAVTQSSDYIKGLIDSMSAEALDKAVFQEMMPQAEAARTSALAKLDMAYRAKLHDEEQAAKRAAEEAAAAAVRKAEQEELAALRKQAADARRAAEAEAKRVADAEAQRKRDESHMLQDLSAPLSQALASKPDAMRHAREAAADIANDVLARELASRAYSRDTWGNLDFSVEQDFRAGWDACLKHYGIKAADL